MDNAVLVNPFRPGAGHMPPHLAGRETQLAEFQKIVRTQPVIRNIILTGLRGTGKTVLLEKFKPLAQQQRWLWAGNDLSESATVTEERLAARILADLAVHTSLAVLPSAPRTMGFHAAQTMNERRVDYDVLTQLFNTTPGLISDKLKKVLQFSWEILQPQQWSGIVFAYDEAQNLADHKERDHFPLSVMLDVFQSIQRMGIPYLLLLTGLPTLFGKLVEARTYSERMFHIMTLERLSKEESRQAILVPFENTSAPFRFTDEGVEEICRASGGYPYFIQFICRETFDVMSQRYNTGQPLLVPMQEIINKLDNDFFAGRWSTLTDRQHTLLWVIAQLPHSNEEFTVQEVVTSSGTWGQRQKIKPFTASHVHQMLNTLIVKGLIYKNRFARYAFAVPLFQEFIQRSMSRDDLV